MPRRGSDFVVRGEKGYYDVFFKGLFVSSHDTRQEADEQAQTLSQSLKTYRVFYEELNPRDEWTYKHGDIESFSPESAKALLVRSLPKKSQIRGISACDITKGSQNAVTV